MVLALSLIFVVQFFSLLNSIRMKKLTSYICSDFNVNLLKINSKRHCNAFYFDMIISHGFFPHITLPTRIADESSTLIDNIFSNDVDIIDTSGVLVKQNSDHQIIFTRHKNNVYLEKIEKYITVEPKNKLSKQNFVDELKQLNICDQFVLHNTSYYRQLSSIFQPFKLCQK